jgi:hypothetical protein
MGIITEDQEREIAQKVKIYELKLRKKYLEQPESKEITLFQTKIRSLKMGHVF